jgi:hypothetical protein
MSWGTNFQTNIYLSRQTFFSKYEIEEKINEYNKTINNIEATFKMFASSTPKDIIPTEWCEEPMSWLNNNLDELYEIYQETLIERYKLYLYQEYVTENNINLSDLTTNIN